MKEDIQPIKAILFDMDGTLIDSESQTDESISRVMQKYNITNAILPPYETRGRTWGSIVQSLIDRYLPKANPSQIEKELIQLWNELTKNVTPIPGAQSALKDASSFLKLTVVSSSPKSTILEMMTKLEVINYLIQIAIVGGDEVKHPKPDPECFLASSLKLEIDPKNCIVFEDSLAGLEAARIAGMHSVAVLYKSAQPDECKKIASAHIEDYTHIPKDFWKFLAQGKIFLASHS